MKVEVVKGEKKFQPFQLKIDVESVEEFRILFNRFNIEFRCLSDSYVEGKGMVESDFAGQLDNKVFATLDPIRREMCITSVANPR